MTLVSLQSIDKLYGSNRILRNLSWLVEDRARVGLVGPNGAGKSTLLRLLAGQEGVQAGGVVRRRGLRHAFLPQHVTGDERSALQVALASRPDLAAVEQDLRRVETDLADPEVYSDPRRLEFALVRQEKLLAQHEQLGGSGFEGEVRHVLLDLGLPASDLDRPMRDLSGGQRKIATLAICVAQRPDLLLLDEPETHLDLAHRELLESLIGEFPGAVVIVSHDRYLLDETVGEIAELEDGAIRTWPGNYSAYALARQLELLRQQELYVAQQKEIDRLEEAIARFRHWAHITVNERHIRQARVKQRQIDQMEKVDRPVLERRKMALRLTSEARGGQKVFELRGVAIGFDGRAVIRRADLTVMRGERVGVVAPNGAGKSVLARLLVGELDPDEGSIWSGPSITVGYYSQGHETLPSDSTPLQLVRSVKPVTENAAVAQLLAFLFTYDQVRRPVSSLSGGERSRLQLMLLMLDGPNCLILDEPTNHLDIDSSEALEAALESYDGTAIVISHDRYFLDRIVDRIVEIRDGRLISHAGGYSAWSQRKSA